MHEREVRGGTGGAVRLFPFWTAWMYASHSAFMNFEDLSVPVYGVMWIYMGLYLSLLPVYKNHILGVDKPPRM